MRKGNQAEIMEKMQLFLHCIDQFKEFPIQIDSSA